MDQRTGRQCAPGDGPAPVHAEIVLPAAQHALAGHWALDRDVLWNTVYLERAAATLRANGLLHDDTLLSFLSPPGWENINLTGDYFWRTGTKPGTAKLRALRPLAAA